jgi:hypothetical protein
MEVKVDNYYFAQKNSMEDFFPCKVIKIHSNMCEVQNLEKDEKVKIGATNIIDITIEKIAVDIATLIKSKGIILYPFIEIQKRDGLANEQSYSFHSYISLVKEENLKDFKNKFNDLWNQFSHGKIEENKFKREIGYIYTINELFQKLEKVYSIQFSPEEKREIILKAKKPRK